MANFVQSKKILVTGGAGFIGSHTLIALVESGYTPVVLDNFSNSSKEVFKRLKMILNGKDVCFIKGDIQDKNLLETIFIEHSIDSVIHFAALKSITDSINDPIKYYVNNIDGTLNLIEVMQKLNVKKIVFSSSATVYAPSTNLPFKEDADLASSNPYGRTKLYVEQILKDLCKADKDFSVIALRYFNPIGAHSSGLIGEDPRGVPTNLFPYITQVAVGKLEKLTIYGSDYQTPDGTGVRDYIHVCDLAEGHVAALNYIYSKNHKGFMPLNLGTGVGTSVLDLVKAFEKVNNIVIPYVICSRREGDLPAAWSSTERVKNILSWETKRSIDDMCRDGWNWQRGNPNGYV